MRAWLLLFLFWRAAAAQGVITTAVGADWVFTGDGLPALNAPLGLLWGLTLDPAGNPVVVDNGACIVAKIRPDATLSVIAGNGFCGSTFVLSGDGGPATSAGISTPYSVTYDPQGNLYVSSFFQVRRIAPDGTISLFAGSPTGKSGSEGDGGPATQALFYSQGGLASDAAGNIYLADGWNNRIRKIARDGTISTFAGNGTASFSGDGGQATAAGLNFPWGGLAFDSLGNLYVADTFNSRIRKIALDGTISTAVSDVDAYSLAFDTAGALYIGGASIVYKIAAGATKAIVIAGNGEPDDGGDGGPASQARLNGIVSVAVDRAGNLYIADFGNYRVRKVGLNGIITTIAGNGNFRYTGEGVSALTAPLDRPSGVAVDGAGNLFFSEELGHRVRKASRGSDGVIRVTTVAGNGRSGLSADPGPAAQSVISGPTGVAVDAAGNLYFGDGVHDVVRKVDAQGVISTYANVPYPRGLAMDSLGNLYVSCHFFFCPDNRVRKVDPRGRITVFAGNGEYGSAGDGGPATSAQLNRPEGLATDAANNLYIADHSAGRVRMVSPGGTITTFAGNGSNGYDGDGGPATQAAIGTPDGVAVDAANNVYIADSGHGRVRKVDTSGRISTFAGGGPSDQTGDGQLATKAAIPLPHHLAADRAGNLYITDSYFERVRVVLATLPTMQVSPATLALPKVASGGAPLTQSVVVTGSIAGLPFDVSIQASGPKNWLTADTSLDITPRLLTLTADPASLAPGSYTATVTIKPVAATPAVLTVSVSLTVGPAESPQLAVDRQAVSFTLPQGGVARSATLQIANSGGQTLSYTASASTASGGNWLAVSPASGQATPGKPAALTVTANPTGLAVGTYTGAVAIQSGAAGSQNVAIIITISGNAQAVLLTQTGLSFTAVAQGGVIPPQSFGVINAGRGVMNWTAGTSVTSGPNWLRVTPTSGASDAAGVVPQVTVSVNPVELAAGKYYGTVRVDAPGTANLSRVLTVFLSVLPAGTAVAASVQPPELVFYATPGGEPPGSQNVYVYNITATSRTFNSARSAGGFGVLTLPSNGSLAPGQPTRVVVQPNTSFSAGTETGTLTFQFSDGTVQGVKITVISASGAGVSHSPALESMARAPSPAASCTPSKLVVSLNTLSQAFQVSAGWPVGLSVKAVDDCSNPLAAGTVWAAFDNGEDDVPLTALGDGTWQGTWRPQSVNPNVTVTINARSGSLPTAQRIVSGAQASANDRPYFTLASIASVFATPAPGVRPLAPGSFLSIYGARLSDFNADAGGALPRQLANTQVYFNDLPAPIHHAEAGQINVVVPREVNLNTSVQVRMQRGATLSEPVAVDIAASHTSILQTEGNAWAMDTPASGGSAFQVTATAPARAGDTLVLYCTGLGATTPPVADGAVSPAAPLATVAGVTAKIGGQNAPVAFAGLVPGFVGLYQLNLAVPSGVTPGAAVPLTVTSGGQTSPAVNLAVR